MNDPHDGWARGKGLMLLVEQWLGERTLSRHILKIRRV
jgi:hypothetical protein